MPAPLGGAVLAGFRKTVTEFTLPNGLHFIVLERHEAPVVSFHTYVNAGSVDDPERRNRHRAHVRAHGVQGHRDHRHQELRRGKALDEVEDIYDQLDAERNKACRRSRKNRRLCSRQLKAAIDKADSYVDPERSTRASSKKTAASALNASTAEDSTNYFYNFPAQSLELWFSAGIRSASSSGFPRVLQGARRGARRAPHARRIRARRASWWRRCWPPRSRRIPIATCPAAGPATSRISAGPKPSVLQEILRAGQHHHRHRRRCESQECRRLAEKYFSTCRRSTAQRPAHGGAGAGRREARAGGIARAALYGDRLQAARISSQRRSGVRRARATFFRASAPASLYGHGARQEDRAGGGRRVGLPGRKISVPVPVLSGAESAATRSRRTRRTATRSSSV